MCEGLHVREGVCVCEGLHVRAGMRVRSSRGACLWGVCVWWGCARGSLCVCVCVCERYVRGSRGPRRFPSR